MKNLLWHEHCIGCITASMFFSVTHASIDHPPPSLVKERMEKQYNLHTKVPSLKWGIENEQNARDKYIQHANDLHTDFVCVSSRLCVNPKYPHLGASPDGIIKCKYCDKGIIEIKCPYKHRHCHPHDISDHQFYLVH